MTVSIIIPSYNHQEYLFRRLESINNQTFKDWEAIIIDDASTDESVDVLNQYLKNHPEFRVKHFITNKENSGSGYNSWQKGILLAQTEFIWIAETDDYCDTNFLEELLVPLKNHENSVLAFCNSNYVDETETILYDSSKRTSNLVLGESDFNEFSGEELINRLPFQTYITNGSSVVFRKPKKELPSFIFENKQSSDIFLWTYLLRNANFIFIKKKLNYFRQHKNSTTSKNYSLKLFDVYLEKIKYINQFGPKEKYKTLIDHYIKFFLWQNKKFFFEPNRLLKYIEVDSSYVMYYYKSLLSFTVRKFLNYGK